MCREVHRGRAARHLCVVDAGLHRREAHNHACLHVRLVEGGRVRAACSSTFSTGRLSQLHSTPMIETRQVLQVMSTAHAIAVFLLIHIIPSSQCRLGRPGRAPG